MSKLIKESTLYSIIQLKCPKCHEGNLFLGTTKWSYDKTLAMPDKCPECHQDFKIEPGFYSGALWVTYPIVLGLAFILLLPLIFIPDYYILIFSLMAIVMLALQPIIMRWGRAIWINIFVHYKADGKIN